MTNSDKSASDRATFIVDRDQVNQHLAALGYQAGNDTIYLRSFYPSDDPRKANDKGRKAQANTLDEIVRIANKFQKEGRGIYLVVNGGGHLDKDVTQGRAIFYEHDNLSKEVQAELWQHLGLPEPTLQVDTGGKSIHSYWVFDAPIGVQDWRSLQTDLLEFADGDRSLKNPSRVMRLAGCWHSWGHQSRIIRNGGQRYDYDQLRKLVPSRQSPEPRQSLWDAPKVAQVSSKDDKTYQGIRYDEIEVPVPAAIPLVQCLSKESRLLIEQGVSQGGRNETGAKLARDLIGTANYLQTIGQQFIDLPEILFDYFAIRCNPPLDPHETQDIWRKAQKANPTPSCSEEGVGNCIRGWYWNNHVKPHQAAKPKRNPIASNDDNENDDDFIEETYNQKATRALYGSDEYIAIKNQLYKWTGTHYELCDLYEEKQRIAIWCNTTPVYIKKHKQKYSYATETHVKNIWKWVLARFSVSPGKLNPPGINCTNGVLVINWDDKTKQPSWELLPHDPKRYYTYCCGFDFNPNADPTYCNQLLECLDPPQREIFIKTLAAGLDLHKIRTFQGREVRALLMCGTGSNGKDALRAAAAAIFGHSACDPPLDDFLAYDNGRRFTLSQMENKKLCWASESGSFISLDCSASLKRAVTGETIAIEEKFEPARDHEMAAAFFFNMNEPPQLKGGMEAIASRWAVIRFTKTFKKNPDPSKGELLANPAFRYDPRFIKEKVAPSLLNMMLRALPEVAASGINYKCTEDDLHRLQEESCHLWSFVRELGLQYDPNGHIAIADLYDELQQWYEDNGWLNIEETASGKQKKEWAEAKRGDGPVKAAKDLFSRFKELFPKIERARLNDEKRTRIITGIGKRPLAVNVQDSPQNSDTASIWDDTTIVQPSSASVQIIQTASAEPTSPISNYLDADLPSRTLMDADGRCPNDDLDAETGSAQAMDADGRKSALSTSEAGSYDEETISDIADWLASCESSETLRDLRSCSIPPELFKLAAKRLPPQKQQQIKEWVLAQNAQSPLANQEQSQQQGTVGITQSPHQPDADLNYGRCQDNRPLAKVIQHCSFGW